MFIQIEFDNDKFDLDKINRTFIRGRLTAMGTKKKPTFQALILSLEQTGSTTKGPFFFSPTKD